MLIRSNVSRFLGSQLSALGLLGLGLAACSTPPRDPPPPSSEPGQRAPASAEADPAAKPNKPEPAANEAPEFHKAGELHYVELVTGGADPNAPLPMIVAIHGLGDDPRNFAGVMAGLDLPARIILPRALDNFEGGGWSWFPTRARDGDLEGLATGIQKAAGVIATGVEQLVSERPTTGKPIVTGFSQGGMLSFALAVEHGELFEAAFPVGGWLPPPLWPESKAKVDVDSFAPIVALHGDADPAVAYEPTRHAVEHLQGLGAEAELHTYPGVRHAIPPKMRAELHDLLRTAAASEDEPKPATQKAQP